MIFLGKNMCVHVRLDPMLMHKMAFLFHGYHLLYVKVGSDQKLAE